MIRVPGQREIVEACYEWSHHYVSFRVDDNETGRDNDTGQADVNFGGKRQSIHAKLQWWICRSQ
jgi:hypothetical protein